MAASRSVYLDARNGKGVSLADVTYALSVDGTPVGSIMKSTQGFTRVQVPAGLAVTVVASWRSTTLPPVELSAERSDHVAWFNNAGPPAILLVCALPLESKAVLATLDRVSPQPTRGPVGDPNLYWEGEYLRAGVARRVLVATTGMGNNNAAIVASHAIRSFFPDLRHVVMVGIAGGCPNPGKPAEHVRLGDVVAVDTAGIIQYDFVKQTVDGEQIRASLQRPARAMLDAATALAVAQQTGAAAWTSLLALLCKTDSEFAKPSARTDVLHYADGRLLAHPKDPARTGRAPRVHRGAIGSANILLKRPAMRDRLRDEFHVRAIEMEGSGLLDAGWHLDKDVMIVRGVCDYCDAFKNDIWQPYAALAAAAYTRALIEMLPDDEFL